MGSFLAPSKPAAPKIQNFAQVPESRKGGFQQRANLKKSTLATGPSGLLSDDENTGTILN